MAKVLKLSTTGRNASVNAIAALLDGGTIEIYNGTMPTNPQTAISSQTLLSELALDATAFGAASTGVATAAAIVDDASANATGTASWARLAGGGTVIDCNVGEAADDCVITLDEKDIVAGGTVSITSFTLTQPES